MSGFITKIDYSDNRQIKQRERTETILSGKTTLGLPFSGLTTGPDETTTVVTSTGDTVLGVFSGNTGTTNFVFEDNRLNIITDEFSAITPANSATTQNTGDVFTGNNSTIIDGNFVNLDYTGTSFELKVTGMTDLGGDMYSGDVVANNIEYLSAGTLDFTGRTIWLEVPGIISADRVEVDTLIIKEHTPTGTSDVYGELSEIVHDDDFLYVKTSGGWRRTSLSTF